MYKPTTTPNPQFLYIFPFIHLFHKLIDTFPPNREQFAPTDVEPS